MEECCLAQSLPVHCGFEPRKAMVDSNVCCGRTCLIINMQKQTGCIDKPPGNVFHGVEALGWSMKHVNIEPEATLVTSGQRTISSF